MKIFYLFYKEINIVRKKRTHDDFFIFVFEKAVYKHDKNTIHFIFKLYKKIDLNEK